MINFVSDYFGAQKMSEKQAILNHLSSPEWKIRTILTPWHNIYDPIIPSGHQTLTKCKNN